MNIFNNAKWIWPKSTQKEINQYCEFIQIIDIEKITDTNIFICATKDYILYVNGEYVESGQWTDYPHLKSYDKINITDSLKTGKNKIAVFGYNPWTDFCSYIQDNAGIIFTVQTENKTYNSGTDTFYRISKLYRNGDIEKLSDQLCYTFEADLKYLDNWYEGLDIPNDFQKINFDDTYLKECSYIERPVKKLIYEPKKAKIIASGPFIRKEEFSSAAQTCDRDFLGGNDLRMKITLPCVNNPKSKTYDVSSVEAKEFTVEKGYFIVDMEDTVAGHLHLDFIAEKDTFLTCSYGEHIVDLRVRGHIDSHNFGFKIYAKEGENVFTHRFFRMGGRYLEIHVTGKATFKDARIINQTYPLEVKHKYISNNSLENKIADVCINTLKNCIHDHFEDTPWREQGLYVLDSRNQSLCNYYVFENFDYIKENIRLFVPTLTNEGHLKLTAPSNFHIPIPIFTYAWVMWLKDYVEYSNDLEFAKEMIPTAKNIVDNIIKSIDNGLCLTPDGNNYWNFVEWKPGLIGDGKNTGKYSLPNNAFSICAMDSLIYILDRLETKHNYKEISNNLKINNHKAFWDKDKELYKTYIESPFDPHYAQISNALALYAHITPQDKQSIVRDQIINNNTLIESTLSMCMYKYEALLQDEKYLDYVFKDIEKQWGSMLYENSTTFWETLPGPWYESGAASLSHGWSSIPIYFYFKYKNKA